MQALGRQHRSGDGCVDPFPPQPDEQRGLTSGGGHEGVQVDPPWDVWDGSASAGREPRPATDDRPQRARATSHPRAVAAASRRQPQACERGWLRLTDREVADGAAGGGSGDSACACWMIPHAARPRRRGGGPPA